ncbi:hypothetical protein [Flavobacterium sp.]|uniref:hypothetical protein n=1 Tax=Flavobacterium sp. TaxID=239 RepID=UPI002602DD17|nr:hypothetical protein [Flavobacterium sp.]
MKTILLGVSVLLCSLNSIAQNKNVQETTKTTVTTVKSSDGEKKFVKNENTTEVQNIELKEAQPNTLNIEMKESPVSVTSTTQITNPDGSTRTVDVDRSSYYDMNGTQYKLALDASGYTMTNGREKPALLRKTSTNSYIFRSKNKTAVGYFDTKGNLVLETYDDKSDKVSVETYSVVKQ